MERKIIISHGDKGGEGKSTLSSVIIDRALARGGSVAVVEGDDTVDDVARRFAGVPGVNGYLTSLARPDTSLDAVVKLFGRLEEESGAADVDVVVVNTPASASATIDAHAEIIIEAAREIGYSVTVAWVLGASPDSARLAGQSQLAAAADRKVAVANARFGPPHRLPWAQSAERRDWLQSGGIESVLPDLTERVALDVRQRQGTFSAMCERDSGLNVITRQVIKSWLRACEPLVDAVLGAEQEQEAQA